MSTNISATKSSNHFLAKLVNINVFKIILQRLK
jgi:hypothetical protein